MWSCVGPANVAPRSVICPAREREVERAPADPVARLEHDDGAAGRASSRAAVRPANPAPMTTTSARSLLRGAAVAVLGSAAAAPLAAAAPISPRRVRFCTGCWYPSI